MTVKLEFGLVGAGVAALLACSLEPAACSLLRGPAETKQALLLLRPFLFRLFVHSLASLLCLLSVVIIRVVVLSLCLGQSAATDDST